ncbi:heme-thiolate peroxidase [Auricularia subglabra TFB-10046 SS5]|nr:heme-thiolate peroxidase [Auricularia subglabra TFB-10046 SS5]
MLGNALTRIYYGLQDFVVGQLRTAFVLIWDGMLQLGNALTFKRKPGTVIREGKPGHGGLWPPFEAPRKTDSRSPCPALNAMANHGIIPRSGRGISFKSLSTTIPDTYNFSKSFAYFTLNYMAEMLQKSYAHDSFDLGDLAVHNGISHDASLTRYDVPRHADQSVPDLDLVDELLACATGKDAQGHAILTAADLARFSAERREHSRDTNGQFTMSFQHKMFSSSNTSTLLTVYGGRVDDLTVILKEERIPDGWEPRVRARNGLTIAALNAVVLPLEFSIPEHRGPRKIRLA